MGANDYVNVTNGNTKLGKAISNINLPVGLTCRSDAPCYKYCYARRGNWRYDQVIASLQKNLDAYLNDSKKYFDSISRQTALNRYVRWHSSGDIVDEQYLAGMCLVARRNKETHYLCFTKKYEIVNSFLAKGKRIPKNLTIVLSAWSDWVPDNPYHLPVAYVYGRTFNNDAIPADAIPCAGKCYECQACWHLRKCQSVYFKRH